MRVWQRESSASGRSQKIEKLAKPRFRHSIFKRRVAFRQLALRPLCFGDTWSRSVGTVAVVSSIPSQKGKNAAFGAHRATRRHAVGGTQETLRFQVDPNLSRDGFA